MHGLLVIGGQIRFPAPLLYCELVFVEFKIGSPVVNSVCKDVIGMLRDVESTTETVGVGSISVVGSSNSSRSSG